MAGKGLKSNSKFWPKKGRKSLLPGEVDRISELPDEIIVAILSLLSVKEAVTTSVLCSRWLDLWKHTPNLDLDSIEMVKPILSSHRAPSLKQFRISFYVDKSGQCEITEWLEFVFSRQVESLELDLLCWEEMHKASLGESLRICRDINVASLRSLCLRCVKLSGEDVELFLRSCPLLERLSICSATLTSDVEISAKILKRLEISCCSGGKSIGVCAPKLTWIRVDDTSGKLLFENVPQLVEADIVSYSDWADDVQHFASAVFSFVSQLRNLKLTLRYPKVFLANEFPEMPELKKLVVVYSGLTKYELGAVTCLIWACPHLEEFRVECMNISRHVPPYVEVIRKVEKTGHRHLKVFELRGLYKGADDHIEFVRYILDNCAALEKIIISPPKFSFCYPLSRRHIKDLAKAAMDYAKQHLQPKLPHHIPLYFL